MKAETQENVKYSFATEAQTFIRYRLYAEQARAEGLPEIGQLFDDIAYEEAFRHGRILADLLSTMESTRENLRHAMDSEEYQFRSLYKAFGESARKMGDHDVANIYDALRQAEMRHHGAFDGALMRLEENSPKSPTVPLTQPQEP